MALVMLAAATMPYWLTIGSDGELFGSSEGKVAFKHIGNSYPTRSLSESPIEGIHFTRGYLHAEGRALGPEDATSFVVEFTDFFCEHCHEVRDFAALPGSDIAFRSLIVIHLHILQSDTAPRCARPLSPSLATTPRRTTT